MAVWQLCINIEASQEGLVPLSLSLRSLSLSVSVRLVRVKSENKILSYRWKNSVGIKMKRQKDGKVDNWMQTRKFFNDFLFSCAFSRGQFTAATAGGDNQKEIFGKKSYFNSFNQLTINRFHENMSNHSFLFYLCHMCYNFWHLLTFYVRFSNKCIFLSYFFPPLKLECHRILSLFSWQSSFGRQMSASSVSGSSSSKRNPAAAAMGSQSILVRGTLKSLRNQDGPSLRTSENYCAKTRLIERHISQWLAIWLWCSDQYFIHALNTSDFIQCDFLRSI